MQTDLLEVERILSNKVKELTSVLRKEGLLDPPNTLYSFYFLLRDLVLFLLTLYGFERFVKPFLATHLGSVQAWVTGFLIYSLVQGTIATGWWVLAHECGHDAFLKNRWLNHAVGYVLHSFLLVPYFSWKYSHAKHHRYTNDLVRGESYVPPSRQEYRHELGTKLIGVFGNDTFVFFQFLVVLILGWPLYLFMNVTGGRVQADLKTPVDPKRNKSHFLPSSQIFPEKRAKEVVISTLGYLLAVGVLVFFALHYGWLNVIYYYGGPYIVVNAWMVVITWLHHSDAQIPHYGPDSFTWSRGALSTVDRAYPWLIDQLHHHVGTTHVLHHIHAKIPHYRAKKGTEIVKRIFGEYYRKDDTPFFKALVRSFRQCRYVEGVEGIQFYKH